MRTSETEVLIEDLISIIVPTYNVENLIGKCLTSLCRQTYTNLEIIIVDDGSSDSTLKVCEKYAKCDPRIVIVKQMHKGVSAARNKGLNTAKGKFVMFVDSDDHVNQNAVRILYNNLNVCNADVSMCDFIKVYEDSDSFNGDAVQFEARGNITMYESSAIFELLWTMGRQIIVLWNKIYRRELFEGLAFPEGLLHEDEFLMHHILSRCSRIVYDDRKLYYYLQRKSSESITSVIGWENIRCSVLAFEDRVSFFATRKEKHHLYKSLERLTKYIIWKYTLVNKKEQKKILISSFRRFIIYYFKSEKMCQKSYWLYFVSPKLYYMLKGSKNE